MQKLTGRTSGAAATTTEIGRAVITIEKALKAYEPTLIQRGARVSKAKLPRHHLSEMLLSKPTTEEHLEGFRDSMLEKGRALEREPDHEYAASTQARQDPHPHLATAG